MLISSKNNFESFESARDFCVQMPTIEQNAQASSSSWHSIFVFTSRKYSPTIAIALISIFASAFFRPTAAIFFGKIFSALTKYGAGAATPENTIHDIAECCTALVALGCCAWIVEGAFLCSWMNFGKSQAKST
jgi:ATP-binding cassette subfamily B (MDR/TAP) protein 1